MSQEIQATDLVQGNTHVILRGKELIGMPAERVKAIINHCSWVKCFAVKKTHMEAVACSVEFSESNKAAEFYVTYTRNKTLICKELKAVRVQESMTYTYDFFSLPEGVTSRESKCQCTEPVSPTTFMLVPDGITTTNTTDNTTPVDVIDDPNPIIILDEEDDTSVTVNNEQNTAIIINEEPIIIPDQQNISIIEEINTTATATTAAEQSHSQANGNEFKKLLKDNELELRKEIKRLKRTLDKKVRKLAEVRGLIDSQR